MFKDWSDEKLLQEVKEGFREYVDLKIKDNQELVNYYQEQIEAKLKEINKLEWEIGVARKNVEEWQEVLDRIDILTQQQEEPIEEEPIGEPIEEEPIEEPIGEEEPVEQPIDEG